MNWSVQKIIIDVSLVNCVIILYGSYFQYEKIIEATNVDHSLNSNPIYITQQ